MCRFTAVAVLALMLAGACQGTTGPDRARSNVAGPSVGEVLQEGPSDAQCIGSLSGEFQNVIVPSGAFCFLSNSTLTGNLKALPDSRLSTFNNMIAGDIQADKALFVDLISDRVGGNIEIVDGPGDPGKVGLLDYRVRGASVSQGNIHVTKNQGNVFVEENSVLKGTVQVEDNFNLVQLIVENNEVLQNIQVYKNLGAGPKVVRFNTAGQSVQCVENQQPFVGTPNTAPNLERQCGVPPTNQ